jgi:hypothetical protein
VELLSVASAKSIWLMNLAELNPKGLRLFPNLSDALTDLYDFEEQADDAPTLPGNASQSGIKFKNGQFETERGFVRVGLEVYDDGLVAETSVSTEVSDKFITHALDWASTAFSLRYNPSLLMNRIYWSEVVVKFGSPISKGLISLNAFAEILSQNTKGNPEYSPSGITFTTSGSANTFTIERRANTPIEANVFYSKAPMDTAMHLGLLAEFEKLLVQE